MTWFSRYNDLRRLCSKDLRQLGEALWREEMRVKEILEGLGSGSFEDEIAVGLEEILKAIKEIQKPYRNFGKENE